MPSSIIGMGGHLNDATLRDATFTEGDRVIADARPGFPLGTVERILDETYLLVRWDGDVLETADHRKLRKVPGPA